MAAKYLVKWRPGFMDRVNAASAGPGDAQLAIEQPVH